MNKETPLIILLVVIIGFLILGIISKSDEAYKQGYSKGYSESYDKGYEDGYTTCLDDYGIDE